MSRLPALNFLLVLLLITFLALRHSASVFAPNGLSASYDFNQKMNSDVLTEQINALTGQLYDLWRPTTIVKEWSAEYQAVTRENLFEPHGAAGDLLDARFHVANAEVFRGAPAAELQQHHQAELQAQQKQHAAEQHELESRTRRGEPQR